MHSNAIQKCAFIGHPVDLDIFRSYVRFLKPDKTYRDELLVKLFEWMPSYKAKEFSGLSFNGTKGVDAALYMVPFLPEMRDIKVKRVIEKIDKVLALASSEGCTVAALGGFTSIVLQGQESNFAKKHNIKITSGNSLTAAIIVRSIETITQKFRIELAGSTIAILGASGDIGSACLGYFCTRVKRIYATARSVPTLSDVVERHRAYMTCDIILSDDNREAVDNANICVFATSATTYLFSAADFRPGAIVCDASAPLTVKVQGAFRNDVFIYHGGIASIPFPLDVGFDLGLASPFTFYGCQLEGLFIALHPELPCSWGRGNISREKLDLYLKKLEDCSGIDVAFSIENAMYTEALLEEYAGMMNNKNAKVLAP
jgi:fatty aldehyde-generating acyl-ACP reductase